MKRFLLIIAMISGMSFAILSEITTIQWAITDVNILSVFILIPIALCVAPLVAPFIAWLVFPDSLSNWMYLMLITMIFSYLLADSIGNYTKINDLIQKS